MSVDGLDVIARDMAEEDLLRHVKSCAAAFGWLVYHTRDSRRSDEGFPDLVLLRPPRLIFAELKTEQGRVTHDQAMWLATFEELRFEELRARTRGAAGVLCEVYVWRPSAWLRGEIEGVLRG
ncbi:MAG TPA: VRR-NUC domain-containing protein [Chloroflexota bacterium]|nr:VRR-NUC domain-containing protein [Chloroflexota bacterium]